MIKVAQVALPVPVGQLFSYKICSDDNLIGYRVLVQFGSRFLTGVITGYGDNINSIELKDIIEVLDDKPFYSHEMLELTKWVADYYMASWGETLKVASPPGLSQNSSLNIELLNEPSHHDLSIIKKKAPKSYEIINYLVESSSRKASVSFLKKKFKSVSIYSIIDSLQNKGIITINNGEISHVRYRKIKIISIPERIIFNDEYAGKILSKLEEKYPEQARIFSYTYIHQKEGRIIKADDAVSETKSHSKSLQALKQKKLLDTSTIDDKEIKRERKVHLSKGNEIELPLTWEQEWCVKEINNAIEESEFKPYLLHGVTGSGKTLVYLHNIKFAMDKGKTSLVLVPEISLTPQLTDRFQNVFGNTIAVMHSKMSEIDRILTWQKIADGTFKIVLGARSALFAPLKNLGLIIVDEEHDGSYKQESPSPRYHARDTAVVRARIEKCTIVLGSATPSVETFYKAKEEKYKLLKLTGRADDTEMPEITTIDMTNARLTGKVEGSFSKHLLDMIEDRLLKKEGTIIYQNRRGFSPVLRCIKCGYVHDCVHCSIKLTHHKSRKLIKCHFCGYTEHYPETCKMCGHNEFESVGFGTQRIESELTEYFEKKDLKVNIDRMDADSTSFRGSQRKILEKFYTGATDILVGTQMIAKGLNLERVTLVGVINSDIQLFLPDFRANEKTFQILTQVSGRAGRKAGMKGQVVIQTFNPENYSIKSAALSQFENFYNKELEIRNSALYPPYSRLITLEFYGTDEDKASFYAGEFRKLLPPPSKNLDILGPFIPTLYKASGYFRRLIIIKSDINIDKSGAKIRTILKNALTSFNLNISQSTVMLRIDIDSHISF